MKVICTIEARMKSERFPGKVLKKIGNYRSLELQVKRLRKSKLIEDIIIATTNDSSDDEIETFAKLIKTKVFRGSHLNIMERIIKACEFIRGDIIVQTTGDCPLIDPIIVDEVIKKYIDSKEVYDLVGNNIKRSFPIGLDCRVFSLKSLVKASRLCADDIHRVHGSTFIYSVEGQKFFKSLNILARIDYNFPEWRLTLDTQEDLNFLNALNNKIKKDICDVSGLEIINFLRKNQDLLEINKEVRQKEIYEG